MEAGDDVFQILSLSVLGIGHHERRRGRLSHCGGTDVYRAC